MTQVQPKTQSLLRRFGRFLAPAGLVLGTVAGSALIVRGGFLEWIFVGAALGFATLLLCGALGHRALLAWIVLSVVAFPFVRFPGGTPLVTFDRLWILGMMAVFVSVPRAAPMSRWVRWFSWALGAFVLWFLLRSVFTSDWTNTGVAELWVDGVLMPTLVFFIAERTLSSQDRRRRAGGALTIAGAFLGFLGIAERILGFQMATLTGGAPAFDPAIGQIRLSGPYSWPHVFALVLLLCLAGTLYWTIVRGPSAYAVGTIVAGAEIVSIGFTFFRAAWLAVPLVVIIVLGIRPKRSLRAILVGLSVFGVLGIVYALLRGTASVEVRLHATANVTGRFATWLQGFHVFAKSPLVGVGINRFLLAQQSVLQNPVAGIAPVGTAHSSFIDVLAEQGAVGTVLLLAVCIGAWRVIHVLRSMFVTKEDAVMSASVAAGAVAYACMSLTLTMLPYGPSNAFMALLLGMGAARLNELASAPAGALRAPVELRGQG